MMKEFDEKINFIFTGVGSALNTSLSPSSLLINRKILIDAPPGIAIVLRSLGLSLSDLECIFITHLHADHFFGLPLLLCEFGLEMREKPLKIYGPLGLEEKTHILLEMAYPEERLKDMIEPAKPQFNNTKDIKHDEVDNLYLAPVIGNHGNIETHGLSISTKSGCLSLYYSSDTELTPEVNKNIQGAQVSILDATTFDFDLPGHMTYRTLERLSSKYSQKHFFATHRANYDVDKSQNKIIIPYVGREYCIYQNIKSQNIDYVLKTI